MVFSISPLFNLENAEEKKKGLKLLPFLLSQKQLIQVQVLNLLFKERKTAVVSFLQGLQSTLHTSQLASQSQPDLSSQPPAGPFP